MRHLANILIIATLSTLALTTGFRPFYFLLYAIGSALVLGYLWAWLLSRGLEVKITRLTLYPQLGQPLFFLVKVQETLGVPRIGLRFRLSGRGVSTSEMVTRLSAKGLLTWTGEAQALWRGPGTAGTFDLVTSDPLGLVRLGRKLLAPYEVLIYPNTVSLPPEEFARFGSVAELGESSRRALESISASKVREYAPGDSLRQIHWPTTARAGHLMAKEFESGGEMEQVWLFLDMRGGAHTGIGQEGTEEAGVMIAASLAETLLAAGKSVGLAMQGSIGSQILPSREPEHLQEIMRDLALVRATGHTPLTELVAKDTPALEQGSVVVFIAPWPGQDLSGIYPYLFRRGITSLPVLLDVATFGRHLDARWVKDPRSEFPGGACFIRRDDDPVQSLRYVLERLI